MLFRSHDRFVEACRRLDYVEYLLDELAQADKAERTEIVSMLTADNKMTNLKRRLKKLREEGEHHEPERNRDIAV